MSNGFKFRIGRLTISGIHLHLLTPLTLEFSFKADQEPAAVQAAAATEAPIAQLTKAETEELLLPQPDLPVFDQMTLDIWAGLHPDPEVVLHIPADALPATPPCKHEPMFTPIDVDFHKGLKRTSTEAKLAARFREMVKTPVHQEKAMSQARLEEEMRQDMSSSYGFVFMNVPSANLPGDGAMDGIRLDMSGSIPDIIEKGDMLRAKGAVDIDTTGCQTSADAASIRKVSDEELAAKALKQERKAAERQEREERMAAKAEKAQKATQAHRARASRKGRELFVEEV